MMAEGRQRPPSSILAAIAQGRAVPAYDGRGACHGAASWQPLPGARLDRRRNSKCGRPAGVPGEGGGSPEVPGVVTCAQGRRRFWHSAVFGERPEGG
jgi:hypothetical protein